MALGVFFAILANIGSALANGLTYVYSRICCRCFRIQRVKSEIPSRVMRKKLRRRLVDEEIGEEAFMPTSSIPIPIGKRILRIRYTPKSYRTSSHPSGVFARLIPRTNIFLKFFPMGCP